MISVPDEPQPLADLTGFQRDILFVVNSLDGTNPNGVHIKTSLREIYGEEINHGRLYQNLRELIDEGLVEKRPVDGRTNAYRVSVVARECLEAHAAWSQWCLMNSKTDEGGLTTEKSVMSSNSTNQTTTSSESVSIESDEDTLARLNNLLARNPEATVGERDSEDFDELYVLPDPDPESGVRIVMGFSAKRGLSHVATFDTDNCETTVVRTESGER